MLVMERDRQLTGFLRGQSDRPIAPVGFELSNPWKASLSFPITATLHMVRKLTLYSSGREADHVNQINTSKHQLPVVALSLH
jgi:hypothetical protein